MALQANHRPSRPLLRVVLPTCLQRLPSGAAGMTYVVFDAGMETCAVVRRVLEAASGELEADLTSPSPCHLRMNALS